MMDFVEIKEKMNRNGMIEIAPNFRVRKCRDLMVRGKDFYAVWDDNNKIWSTDEYDVAKLVDDEIIKYNKKFEGITPTSIQTLADFSSDMWTEFKSYISKQPDCYHPLDEKLTFMNHEVKREDYVSKRLEYPLESGSTDAYEEIISTLYIPEERAKLEWAIGAIIDGDSKIIQKFIVLYGAMGSGKSTILNIIQKLFKGYYTTFEAKALTSNNNSFATEVFKSNPLVAIQHDGDLSKIEDNTKLNSIISHEVMTMNEKYKASYMSKTNCFLFMGTNKPVKITDAKSGIIRRLIDVQPSGNKIPPKRYEILMAQIDFELGAIAQYCLDVYHSMGKNYYANYKPLDMMLQTDVFFNFVESNYFIFKEEDGVSLTIAYEMYKQYCDESLVEFKLPKYKFREELKNYFSEFNDMTRIDGKQVRSYYNKFQADKFASVGQKPIEEPPSALSLEEEESAFDLICATNRAQYAFTDTETPMQKWIDVTTILSDLDTKKLHYIAMPENHIVIDFDLKDENGEKSYEKNIMAANSWPPTYAELSKGGKGVHLHYIYDGDATRLSRIYEDNIEIKVFVGNSALRRKLTKCNNLPVATINSGLPLKGEKMINFDGIKNERALRTIIKRNLNKEIHPGTKSSVDFIDKILDDAYKSGLSYDVTDMRPQILAFANNSSNQAMYCIKLVNKMKYQSEEQGKALIEDMYIGSQELVFFDVEVYPNLFIVVWKVKGKDKKSVKMINPSSSDIEALLKMKLVGFNCRRYDNHILYARLIGYTNIQLYELSQKIINNSRNGLFGEAYNISYTDVYDFASAANKKGLKKFEIELGIHHQEMGLPWDKEVPEALWDKVADYCNNDVEATEVVFDYLSADWVARQILAELSGLTVNDTTNMHSTKIVFGNEKHPQDSFIYTDLSIMFPGYKFENGVSTYRGEVVSEGGYVHGEPGMYGDALLLDIASMHPTSAELMNCFGPYTKKYSDIKKARMAIKHKDYKALETLMDGKLIPFINKIAEGLYTWKDLANALKTPLNSAYGLTSAKFENPFRDPRNIDNIVAKRGALFMIDLKHAVQQQGWTVAHIKTDSIKIPEGNDEIIKFVTDFGKKYGYDFEHEATYDKLCLVNDAVYIARYGWTPDGKDVGKWTATGAQFAQPYVFKTLFSKESIVFEDMCETKSVTSALYLDMNEGLKDNDHSYTFIGKVGLFCPIKEGCGGGLLVREKDGKYNSASGAKGYRWLEAEMVKVLGKEKDIDRSYYSSLCDNAVDNINNYKFGMYDFDWFVSSDTYNKELDIPF